jgi:hypothetical protein
MFKFKLFNKRGYKQYDRVLENYISVQNKKIMALTEKLEDLDPTSEGYLVTVEQIKNIEFDVQEEIARLDVRKTKPKRKFISSEAAAILASVIGGAVSITATAMLINNERDGNMTPPWARGIVDKATKGK